MRFDIALLFGLGLATGAAAQHVQFVSYEAMQRNTVPCSKRSPGLPDNCLKPGTPPNLYTRGCSVITRCARVNNN
ncbi:rapid alkalinization factor-like [Diplodia corticola]|uniref:Rapid alkalinization factor-like n=1 Tax=Diplodia corticola TaxID=236234 RepID=A0A1J9RMF1_9PEZI|nr:rapid alkalinization factor-like [Diplodia corticola]OJD29092.1 rapid alkalinization factor-like [Diplodia corticola]